MKGILFMSANLKSLRSRLESVLFWEHKNEMKRASAPADLCSYSFLHVWPKPNVDLEDRRTITAGREGVSDLFRTNQGGK